jgi:hypothetical protein
MWHVWGRGELYRGFWWENMKERGHVEDLGIDGRILLKCMLRKHDAKSCTGFGWLKIYTSGGLL